jgi:hypothetical protein
MLCANKLISKSETSFPTSMTSFSGEGEYSFVNTIVGSSSTLIFALFFSVCTNAGDVGIPLGEFDREINFRSLSCFEICFHLVCCFPAFNLIISVWGNFNGRFWHLILDECWLVILIGFVFFGPSWAFHAFFCMLVVNMFSFFELWTQFSYFLGI